MADWRKILCAVDFGEPSREAMREAAELARRSGAELALVHVQAAAPRIAGELFVPTPEAAERALVEVRRLLAGWRVAAERIAARPLRSTVLSGDPAREIVRFARASRADLVVVGTHGRGALGRIVLGSVAEKVVRDAHCPVLVARRTLLPTVQDADDAEDLAAEAAQQQMH
jgi:nucleotide-binding universal stress UspA family protein